MRDPKLSQMLAAAAALLLRPPDACAISALVECSDGLVSLDEARQDFYDVLCVPQSGRYIPPYAHVLAQGRVRDGDWWNFPPPRYDGGDALAPWYDAVGFDPMLLDVDPMLRGPHRPLDQVGFLIVYLSGLVATREDEDADSAADGVIAAFMAEHLGPWLDRFCELVRGSGSVYLRAVADATDEAVQAARSFFPPATPSLIAAAHASSSRRG